MWADPVALLAKGSARTRHNPSNAHPSGPMHGLGQAVVAAGDSYVRDWIFGRWINRLAVLHLPNRCETVGGALAARDSADLCVNPRRN